VLQGLVACFLWQMSGLDLSYGDPERGWDRNRVKGVSAAASFGGGACLLRQKHGMQLSL
jgi:hypothetical protein